MAATAYCYDYDRGVSYPGYHEVLPDYYSEPPPGPTNPFYIAPSPGRINPLYSAPPPDPINPLFSAPLTNLSRQTQANLDRLKQKLVNIDPCYAFGMEHWHNDRSRPVDSDIHDNSTKPKWDNRHVMFTSSREMAAPRGTKIKPAWEDSDTNNNGAVNNYCYLCSTLEEHEQHLARRGHQFKPKHKPKLRIEFIAPPPMVKKKRPEVEEAKDVLYKIVLKTGRQPNAGTSANVFVKLNGRDGFMKKRKLQKKLATTFSFGRGTSETFYVKGPEIGELSVLSIQHDGLEQKHSWYLEVVEVTNMTSGQIWRFPCKAWLSLYLGDMTVSRHLRAEEKEIQLTDYQIAVFTADKRLAGTDANVFVTLYGKQGSTKKLPLRNKSKNNFERGQEDIFNIMVDEIGVLTKIRIEHDNSGFGPGWLLEKVEISDRDNDRRSYTLPCGEWLATDEGNGETFKILYPLSKNRSRDAARKKSGQDDENDYLDYEVSVLTGDVRNAGTDANVYLQLFGKAGTSGDIVLDDEKDNFERGKTDTFKVKGPDVGDLKRIRIRHDNSGLGAGWFLDKIVIKRFFAAMEVLERMKSMQADVDESVARRAAKISGTEYNNKDRATPMKHKRSFKKDKDRERNRTPSKYDDSNKKRRTPHKQKKNKFNYGGVDVTETDTESEEDIKKHGRTKKHRNKSKYDTDSSDDNKKYDKKKKEKKRKQKRKKYRLRL